MSLIIVSNREPLREEAGRWTPSVGGLTTALVPVLEQRGGVWIAWGEEGAAETPCISYPPENPAFEVRRLELSEEEVSNYYYGLANRVLWPVCHYFTEQIDLQRHFYTDYVRVNRRFAAATAEAYNEGDLVWIQDYQLMLAPLFLREAKPEARIGFFFHIPWPAAEVWRILPWARRLTEGLLSADLVGFHTDTYVQNFLDCAHLVGAEVEGNRVRWGGREIRVEVHPIGIDTNRFRELAQDSNVRALSEQRRAEAGSEFVLLGVDRLDYTKGVLERLLAFETFLETYPDYRGRVTFYQIASPSRTRVESYQNLKRAVDEVAGRINGAYMQEDWVPVRYLYRTYSQEELTAFYLAADAALITPLRDGMNMVSQEFACVTERGMLILSNLTGAASFLSDTLLVNPYDVEGTAHTIKTALSMAANERSTRMKGVKAEVDTLDVHDWAKGFLDALESA